MSNLTKFYYYVPFEKRQLKYYVIPVFAETEEESKKILESFFRKDQETEFPEFFEEFIGQTIRKEDIYIMQKREYKEKDKEELTIQEELLLEETDTETETETETESDSDSVEEPTNTEVPVPSLEEKPETN